MQVTVKRTAYHSVLLVNGLLAPLLAGPTFKSFRIPTDNSQPRHIFLGSDGNKCFTEFNADRVSQITPDGVVTEVKKVKGGPWGIGAGVDNTIWFTLFDGNKIARVRVGP